MLFHIQNKAKFLIKIVTILIKIFIKASYLITLEIIMLLLI